MTTWTLHKPLDLSRFDLWSGDGEAQARVTSSTRYRLERGDQSLELHGRGLLYDGDDHLLPFGDLFRIDLFDALEQALEVLDIAFDLLELLSNYNPFTGEWDIDGLVEEIFEDLDRFVGSEGDDVFAGFGGNDLIDGGGGLDTARFRGDLADYRLEPAPGGWQVTDTAGRDGADVVTGVERLHFADRAVALDLDGDAGTVARLIATLFGVDQLARADFAGAGLAVLDGGQSAEALAALAVASAHFAAEAGSHGTADFVRQVYGNVTGRQAPADVVQQYVALVDSGAESRASLALWASGLDEVRQQVALAGVADTGLVYDLAT